MRTFPAGRSVAVCEVRAMASEPVDTNVPLAGSYNSPLPRSAPPLDPPETNTLPEGSRVAVWLYREALSEAVDVQVPVPGSYTSAVASGWDVLVPTQQR